MENKEFVKKKKGCEKAVISFLKSTREGKYAIIDQSSLTYSRFSVERDNTEIVEEDLHYSIG